MFEKILIANRGEIACRIIKTANRLGVDTVAVFSDADAMALHVKMAQEAVHIGPAPVGESYLQGERIIDAALSSGAQAIHPGYGFLSENPEFADAVEAAGLTFIGPPAHAIRAMGLKDAAKTLMEKAGVPVVPGYHGDNQDPVFLQAEAAKLGYPVLIKARAGGGGKGMRLVGEPGDFANALASAQREALASFGDAQCLIEKYIQKPRHVEIQVFADGHGNVVHLFERDCSLQRRHQKVVEEAPAPGMPALVRAAMGKAAIGAARAIGYAGAGTIEFIADGASGLREDGFWFMEMNTRLQVEHPVTEAITGQDLVEWQLRVAAGGELPLAQDELSIHGHAFEVRIYAEDVPRGFLPATGTLRHLQMPAATSFKLGDVRVDSGVIQGDTITPFYDPMIAKLIVHDQSRPAALRRMQRALDQFHIAGSVTNLAFLRKLVQHEEFASGNVDTGLIARDEAGLAALPEPSGMVRALAAILALGLSDEPITDDPWQSLVGWRLFSNAEHHITIHDQGEELRLCITLLGDGQYHVSGLGIDQVLSVENRGRRDVTVTRNGYRCDASWFRDGHLIWVFAHGHDFEFSINDPLAVDDEQQGGGDALSAPMPGLVKLVKAAPGDMAGQGDLLIVLEAMKMEHSLTAPRDGVIAQVNVAEGDQVNDGMVLVTLEPGSD